MKGNLYIKKYGRTYVEHQSVIQRKEALKECNNIFVWSAHDGTKLRRQVDLMK